MPLEEHMGGCYQDQVYQLERGYFQRKDFEREDVVLIPTRVGWMKGSYRWEERVLVVVQLFVSLI